MAKIDFQRECIANVVVAIFYARRAYGAYAEAVHALLGWRIHGRDLTSISARGDRL